MNKEINMRTINQLQRDVDHNNSGWESPQQLEREDIQIAKDKQLRELDKMHIAIQNNVDEIDKHKSDGIMASIMISMLKLQIKDLADIAKTALEKI